MIEKYEVGTLAIDGWAQRGTTRTGLQYDCPLLCGFNVPVKGLTAH